MPCNLGGIPWTTPTNNWKEGFLSLVLEFLLPGLWLLEGATETIRNFHSNYICTFTYIYVCMHIYVLQFFLGDWMIPYGIFRHPVILLSFFLLYLPHHHHQWKPTCFFHFPLRSCTLLSFSALHLPTCKPSSIFTFLVSAVSPRYILIHEHLKLGASNICLLGSGLFTQYNLSWFHSKFIILFSF